MFCANITPFDWKGMLLGQAKETFLALEIRRDEIHWFRRMELNSLVYNDEIAFIDLE